MAKIVYQEAAPHPSLKELIFNYWSFSYTGEQPVPMTPTMIEHLVPPDACFSVGLMTNSILNINRAFLTFPTATESKLTIPPDSYFWGVRIMPGEFESIFNIQIADAKTVEANQLLASLGLDSVLNLGTDNNRFDLLDDAIKQTLSSRTESHDKQLKDIVDTIIERKGQITVSEIVRNFHIHERNLQRKFARYVGLSPLEFIRIRRVRAAIIDFVLNKKTSAMVATASGYVDQSHMIKELKKITGESPRTLTAYLSEIEHIGHIV